MKKSFLTLFSLFLFFTSCRTRFVNIETSIDPDIVLINIENGDREFISKVLQKVDSLKPLVVGIDVTFQGSKKQDSFLTRALEHLGNDVLVYTARQDGSISGSDPVFTKFADQGNLNYEQKFGLVTTIIPLQNIKDSIHESFPLKIIKKWKPDFVASFKVDEKMDIEFSRDGSRFMTIAGSGLVDTPVDNFELANKVFLVGYTGPGNEDKYFTPLRSRGDFRSNEPDTYGLVIVGNAIRTILSYQK